MTAASSRVVVLLQGNEPKLRRVPRDVGEWSKSLGWAEDAGLCHTALPHPNDMKLGLVMPSHGASFASHPVNRVGSKLYQLLGPGDWAEFNCPAVLYTDAGDGNFNAKQWARLRQYARS